MRLSPSTTLQASANLASQSTKRIAWRSSNSDASISTNFRATKVFYSSTNSPGPKSTIRGRNPGNTADPTNDLSNKVKSLMRYVPHPVAVITSTDVSINRKGGASAWRGITVSSFNTVTLHPKPIVSFNIKKLSSTYEAIKSSGLFNVHLFSRTENAINIAGRFSRGNAASPFHEDDGSLAQFAIRLSPGEVDGRQDINETGAEPPVIRTHPDSQFIFRCASIPEKSVEFYDHMVLFGEVRETFKYLTNAEESSVFMNYANGRYL